MYIYVLKICLHYVKSVQRRIFSGPYFPIFALNTEIESVIQTRKKLVFEHFLHSICRPDMYIFISVQYCSLIIVKCINFSCFKSIECSMPPVGIYLLKVNSRNTRRRCVISSILTTKTSERRHLYPLENLHTSYRILYFSIKEENIETAPVHFIAPGLW